MMRAWIIGLAALASACATPREEAGMPSPIVIAHRGASGERPEHTLSAYRLAIAQGADFIEPDLVMTKDGVLVARHENEISGTTDVAQFPEFAARRRTQIIDGDSVTGWFTEDFTLAELKRLRARERLPELRPQNTAFDGQDEIPTLEEVLALARTEGARMGRRIGVYPETKHPSHFAGLGLAMETPLVAALARHGFSGPNDPAFIQSFEVGNLQALRAMTRVRLVQLVAEEGGPADLPGVTYAAMLSDAGLAAIAAYADGLGPQKTLILPRDAQGRSMSATDLVARAHAAGLKVHPWTFRVENAFLPAELRAPPHDGTPAGDAGALARAPGDLSAELKQFYALGVDGVFSDSPAIAVGARGKAGPD